MGKRGEGAKEKAVPSRRQSTRSSIGGDPEPVQTAGVPSGPILSCAFRTSENPRAYPPRTSDAQVRRGMPLAWRTTILPSMGCWATGKVLFLRMHLPFRKVGARLPLSAERLEAILKPEP